MFVRFFLIYRVDMGQNSSDPYQCVVLVVDTLPSLTYHVVRLTH